MLFQKQPGAPPVVFFQTEPAQPFDIGAEKSDLHLAVYRPDDVGNVGHERAIFGLTLPDLLLGLHALGHIASDPDQARDAPLSVPYRHLAGYMPTVLPIGLTDLLNFADQRLAGLDDLLLVLEVTLGVFRGEEIEVGFSHRLARIGQAQHSGVGGIRDEASGFGGL